jgi:DNA-binding CsgD family transcriptional regulator
MTLDHDTEHLTPRERDVLALATRGLRNEEIAAELGLTENAVRFHLKRLHAKLDTGGDRKALSGFRGWLSGGGFLFGGNAVAAMPIIGLGVLGLGLAGAAVLFYPGDSSASNAEVTPDAQGFYPNGCPAVMSPPIDIETIEDFARVLRVPLEELRALNPGLPDGVLPAEAEVRVPYQPQGACGEATMTRAGADAATDLGFAFEVVSAGGTLTSSRGGVAAGDTESPSPDVSRGICFRVYGKDAVADLRPFKLLLDGTDRRSELTWFVAPDYEYAEACLAPAVLAIGQHEAVILFEDLASDVERELTRWSFEIVLDDAD